MNQFDSTKLKSIGVLTSGGDSPGMNAAIRAITRTALYNGYKITGIFNGYKGLIEKLFEPITTSFVGNIMQRGGTVLKCGRCLEFMDPKYRKISIDNLRSENIDALIVIGGDGSITGAKFLWDEFQFPITCIPGTIDNDIYGTDLTVGFDTAVNTAVEAIDKIRDTAFSHDRLFIVEVMGRETGFIALEVGLACGAEEIFIPENPVTVELAIAHMKKSMARGKLSSILITAEGRKPGRAYDLAEAIKKKSGLEAKVCILGHLQRGGSPSALDRVLASQMGTASVEALKRGHCNTMMGIRNNEICYVPLQDVISNKKPINHNLILLAQNLSS